MKGCMTQMLSSTHGRVMLGFKIWRELPIIQDKQKIARLNKF